MSIKQRKLLYNMPREPPVVPLLNTLYRCILRSDKGGKQSGLPFESSHSEVLWCSVSMYKVIFKLSCAFLNTSPPHPPKVTPVSVSARLLSSDSTVSLLQSLVAAKSPCSPHPQNAGVLPAKGNFNLLSRTTGIFLFLFLFLYGPWSVVCHFQQLATRSVS